MRFKLTLVIDKKQYGSIIPINYQYEQSAVIYNTLSRASEKFSLWLHENGYQLDSGKRFKLFTYSPLKIEKRKILKDTQRLQILSDTVEWQISFLCERSTQQFIQGVFSQQVFELGDRLSRVRFRIQSVELLPTPIFTEEMEFVTMSPIFIRYKNSDGKVSHLSPTDERSKNLIKSNLLSKYEAYNKLPYSDDFDFNFELLDEPKQKLITIKSGTPEETHIVCYLCKFSMCAPIELMKIAYESGIGNENSQGFGCIRVEKSNN
ncbi:MAG: CRISPR-associated endoribonuclease Cas6 [Bacteroidia bacterium]|nr:CRISPR-associated endoribonuclease Cas6 [Bacteroidia bacterium]